MRFVEEHRDEHGVEPIIDALQGTCAQIAPSTYYAARARAPSARTVADVETLTRIRAVHDANYGVYGARKTWRRLARQDHHVARCTVERVMRANGIRGITNAKSPRTTIPGPDGDWFAFELEPDPQKGICAGHEGAEGLPRLDSNQ